MYHKWQSYDVWFLRYGVRQSEFFVILDYFLPFYPSNNSKNQNFEKKWRKMPEDILILHMCTINENHDVRFLRYRVQQIECFVILYRFFPFYPPNDTENQNFETMKKIPGDIINLPMCTINDYHMMYGSWDMELYRQNFLSFWTTFCPFTTLTTWKIKIEKKKNEKNTWRYYHFTQAYNKWLSSDVWFLRYEAWQTEFLSFWAIFCSFITLTTRKIQIKKKNEKNTWRYHFTYVYHKW